MIQEICKDEKFLAQKAEQATPDDIQTATDLLETLEAHKDGCVGMAANMIGVCKRIIVFDNEGTYMVMFNPQIVKQSGGYEAEEGLPVADRHAQNASLAIHQGAVPERKVPDETENLHWLDRTDYPARNRPLRGYYHLRNKQNVNQRIQKRHTKRCAFFLPFAQAQAAAYRSTPIQFPEKVRLCRTFFSTARAAAARPRPLCGREGISHKVSTELCGYLRGQRPLRRRFSPAARSYPVRKERGNADGTRSDPPVLRCWRPRGSCPCRAPWQSSQ